MRRAAATACLALAAVALLGVKRPNGLADVLAVRHWSYPDYTRVVVEVSKPVERMSEVRHLDENRAASRPQRLYVDIGGLWVGRRYVKGIELGDGLLRGVRLGQNELHTTRLVLDIEHYESHRLFTLEHPSRIVIDVFGRRDRGDQPVPDSRVLTPRRFAKTVVIDPGHGGHDPGAIGIGGLREKGVTLSLALTLGAKLAKEGFDVVYTREDDRFVSLEERTAIAESQRADLFVSVHANAAPRRSAQGIETYYLDKDYERHSLTVAARENGISRHQVDALQHTLAQFRVGELSTHSERLASLVQRQIVRGMPRRYAVQDLGVKKGPFYVLFLSDTPAILVEAGFLTNRAEAKRLRDRSYLEAVATQIAAGLTQYRSDAPEMAWRGPR